MMSETSDNVGWGGEATLNKSGARWHWITFVSMFGWAGAFMAATYILGEEYYGLTSWVGYLFAGISIALSAVSVYAYWNFLHHCDEMQQRIQLNGLALGFGVGLVFMMGYRLLERMGAPASDVNDAVFWMLMSYVLGVWISTRRYR